MEPDANKDSKTHSCSSTGLITDRKKTYTKQNDPHKKRRGQASCFIKVIHSVKAESQWYLWQLTGGDSPPFMSPSL